MYKSIISLFIIINIFSCKKNTVSNIGMDIINPKEGVIISFAGSTNRLYFVKVNISSAKALQQIEYKITNATTGAVISAYLDDDLHSITDTNLDISEYMPAGNIALNVKLVCKITDVDNFSISKTVNYSLAP